ncbi:MAG: hypothetical protein D6813_08995 [Calditrichaeota bacterium]|nr:MAG: hypothetical protein D6813_08995 [Calditrichota bacterium]
MSANSQKFNHFHLARSSVQTKFGKDKLAYKRNLEKSIIITLFLVIGFFHLSTHFKIKKLTTTPDQIKFELIDIPLVEPVVKKPKMQIEHVVEIKKEEPGEKNKYEEMVDELLEKDEEIKLSLNENDMNAYLISGSALGSIADENIKFRHGLYDHAEGDISYKNDNSNLFLEEDTKFDLSDHQPVDQKIIEEQAPPNLELSTRKDNKESTPQTVKDDVSLQFKKFEKVLTFAGSSIGTEDYKLWNKINAELDRISKGRYGPLPDALRWNAKGFVIKLKFADRVIHEIHWQKNGRVWIKVIGKSNKSSLQELRRALQGLLQLTIQ